jgi:hypothetical protein
LHLAYLLSLQREHLRLERRIGPDSRGRARARARALVERRRRRKEGGGKKGRSSARETRQAGVYRRGGVAAREPPRRGGTTEQRRRRAAVGGGGGGGEARVRRHRRFWRGRVGLGRVRVVRVPNFGTASSRHLRWGHVSAPRGSSPIRYPAVVAVARTRLVVFFRFSLAWAWHTLLLLNIM